MHSNVRNIAIMIGSDSDLPQCKAGLEYLAQMMADGKINVVGVFTNSIHRNTRDVFKNLKILADNFNVDCLIAGAGWANHISGTCDAYLRYTMKNDKMHVIAVAFEDKKDETNTLAARLSIERVPGHQMLGPFVGAVGFLDACGLAVAGNFPPIILKDPKPVVLRSITEAIDAAKIMTTKKEA